jgi:EAL domain-containing protein (putative c-di-GMP-specific phosphodiesterase class I)
VAAALDEGRIDAWYQPIVRFGDRRIVGLEALCRMVSTTGEIVSASGFAEATTDPRISSRLIRRMLSQIADDMRSWRDLGIAFGEVSVNVTAVDLRGGRLLDLLDEIFASRSDLLGRLVLEVNETVAMGDRDRIVFEAIRALRARGLRIALDDFGTGYASLMHLLDLPIDVIKIDKSFTARLTSDDVSATIIASLVAIARKLGASVTVEGVETVDQIAQLVALDCSHGQGFHFSPAVNRSEAARLLVRHAAGNRHSVPLPELPPAVTARQPRTASPAFRRERRRAR